MTAPPDFARRLMDSLKSVHNFGARIYNEGKHTETMHLYKGALMVAMQLLTGQPDLKFAIAEGLSDVERSHANDQVKAFRLHEVLDHVRDILRESLAGSDPNSAASS